MSDTRHLPGDPKRDAHMSIICVGPPNALSPAVFNTHNSTIVESFLPAQGFDTKIAKLAKQEFYKNGYPARMAGNIDGSQETNDKKAWLQTLYRGYFKESQYFELMPEETCSDMPTGPESIAKNLRRRVVYNPAAHRLQLYDPNLHDSEDIIYVGTILGALPKGEKIFGENQDEANNQRIKIQVSQEKLKRQLAYFDPLFGDKRDDDMATPLVSEVVVEQAIAWFDPIEYPHYDKVTRKTLREFFVIPAISATFPSFFAAHWQELIRRSVFISRNPALMQISLNPILARGFELPGRTMTSIFNTAREISHSNVSDNEREFRCKYLDFPFDLVLGVTAYVSRALSLLVVATLATSNPHTIFNAFLSLRYAFENARLAFCLLKDFNPRKLAVNPMIADFELLVVTWKKIRDILNKSSDRLVQNMTVLRLEITRIITTLEPHVNLFQEIASRMQSHLISAIMALPPATHPQLRANFAPLLSVDMRSDRFVALPTTELQFELAVRLYYRVCHTYQVQGHQNGVPPNILGLGLLMQTYIQGWGIQSSRLEYSQIFQSGLYKIPWTSVETAFAEGSQLLAPPPLQAQPLWGGHIQQPQTQATMTNASSMTSSGTNTNLYPHTTSTTQSSSSAASSSSSTYGGNNGSPQQFGVGTSPLSVMHPTLQGHSSNYSPSNAFNPQGNINSPLSSNQPPPTARHVSFADSQAENPEIENMDDADSHRPVAASSSSSSAPPAQKRPNSFIEKSGKRSRNADSTS